MKKGIVGEVNSPFSYKIRVWTMKPFESQWKSRRKGSCTMGGQEIKEYERDSKSGIRKWKRVRKVKMCS